jgi:hypothetical protein
MSLEAVRLAGTRRDAAAAARVAEAAGQRAAMDVSLASQRAALADKDALIEVSARVLVSVSVQLCSGK